MNELKFGNMAMEGKPDGVVVTVGPETVFKNTMDKNLYVTMLVPPGATVGYIDGGKIAFKEGSVMSINTTPPQPSNGFACMYSVGAGVMINVRENSPLFDITTDAAKRKADK